MISALMHQLVANNNFLCFRIPHIYNEIYLPLVPLFSSLPSSLRTFSSLFIQKSLSAVYMFMDVRPPSATWGTYQWSHPQKMNLSLPPTVHCQQLPSKRWGLEIICLLCAGILIGLLLYRTCAGKHSCCDIMNAITVPFPGEKLPPETEKLL